MAQLTEDAQQLARRLAFALDLPVSELLEMDPADANQANRCHARTNNGSRCGREGHRSSFAHVLPRCHQHWETFEAEAFDWVVNQANDSDLVQIMLRVREHIDWGRRTQSEAERLRSTRLMKVVREVLGDFSTHDVNDQIKELWSA